nr:Uncharacterised protein [Salmonella sp. NCTC 7297]
MPGNRATFRCFVDIERPIDFARRDDLVGEKVGLQGEIIEQPPIYW